MRFDVGRWIGAHWCCRHICLHALYDRLLERYKTFEARVQREDPTLFLRLFARNSASASSGAASLVLSLLGSFPLSHWLIETRVVLCWIVCLFGTIECRRHLQHGMTQTERCISVHCTMGFPISFHPPILSSYDPVPWIACCYACYCEMFLT